MFSELLNKIKQAIKRMFGLTPEQQAVDVQNSVSPKMQKEIEKWKRMYMDNADWLGGEAGIKSLGISGEICSKIAKAVTLEMESNITEPNETEIDETEDNTKKKPTRASYLNGCYHKRLLSVIRQKLEYALGVGGMIIKPYVNNDNIYFDYLAQGEFAPLQFDDDGNITDIAFPDILIANGKRYTKIERHIFDALTKTVTVVNKAFVSNDVEGEDLGNEIPLSQVAQWANLSEEPIIINDCERPLYGFYKVPKANHIDVRSPLGASIFARGEKLIEDADKQYSRLDWEYDAGQLAVDVDPTVIDPTQPNGYNMMIAQGHKRAFRGVDVDDMYSVFAPALRDANYIEGLNVILMRIEDVCELYRGTISNVQNIAHTATEVLASRQETYSTVTDNQKALENCLNDVIYAMDKYVDLYGLAPKGDYTVSYSWDDSMVTDKASELTEKVSLMENNLLADYEVRAWYTGETHEKAKEMCEEIKSRNEVKLASDLFGSADDSGEDEE